MHHHWSIYIICYLCIINQLIYFTINRGHGTYVSAGSLKATVAGVEQNINKLVTVSPLRCRYNGEIGDVVIGRVTELVHKRWKIDINNRLDAVLLLTSIQLPGGELVSSSKNI